MKQRTAVLLTTALTAFVIVMTLGVTGAMSFRSQTSTSDPEVMDSAATEVIAVPEPPATATQLAATNTPLATEPVAPAGVVQPDDGQQPAAQPELVDYEGTPAYEIKYDGGVMYVDARTGAILYDTRLDGMVTQLEPQVRANQFGNETASRESFESHEDHEDHDRD